ncbi:MAG: flagellin [Sulfuricurvum sp.]
MKVDTSSSALMQMNNETQKSNSELSKIGAAISLGLQDNASRIISDSLQSSIDTSLQGLTNANDAISMMQIAGGVLNGLSAQSQALNTLSVQYNSAALNADQKVNLQSQFSDIAASMQQMVNSATYNGNALFGNTQNISTGNSTQSYSIPSFSPTSLDINNSDSLKSFTDQIASAQSDIGSSMSSLSSSANTLIGNIVTTAAAKSNLSETDIAKAINDYQQNKRQLDVSQIMQAHQQNLQNLNLQQLLG